MAETTQRNEFEDIITAIIGGGLKGYSSGRQSELELRKEMWKEKLKHQLNPPEYKPRTMEEALEFKRAESNLCLGKGRYCYPGDTRTHC